MRCQLQQPSCWTMLPWTSGAGTSGWPSLRCRSRSAVRSGPAVRDAGLSTAGVTPRSKSRPLRRFGGGRVLRPRLSERCRTEPVRPNRSDADPSLVMATCQRESIWGGDHSTGRPRSGCVSDGRGRGCRRRVASLEANGMYREVDRQGRNCWLRTAAATLRFFKATP